MLGRVLASRFTVLARIGSGSMGTVYRAKQSPIARDVAIKILRSDRAVDEVSRARRHARPLTVAVVDIDRFGDVGDRVGQDEAEQSLLAVGSLLRSVVRDEDVVARLGADEFGIAFV